MSPKEISLQILNPDSDFTAWEDIGLLANAYLELLSENEATEKVYRMNRKFVEDTKAENTKLKEEKESVRLELVKQLKYNTKIVLESIDKIEQIKKLKKSREVLRDACEFYASDQQWSCTQKQITTYDTIGKDDLGIGDFQLIEGVDDDRVGGKKAREALKADNEIMEGK